MNRSPAVRRALGAVLREIREELDLSQEDLGERAGVHRTHVGSIERGETNPTFENLLAIVTGLGVGWEELGRRLDAEAALRPRAPRGGRRPKP